MNSDNHSSPASSSSSPELPPKNGSTIFETVRFVAIWLIVIAFIRVFIAQPFIVDGLSMFPTFNDKDYLIVDEVSYRFENPARGDVVIFQYPCPNISAQAATCPKDTLFSKTYYIKRIIGLPGETIVYNPGQKVVIKNAANPKGFTIEDSYISGREDANNIYQAETVTLGKDEYFVMGDNRPRSSDSRIWGILPRSKIVGRPILRLLPLSNINALPGAVKI